MLEGDVLWVKNNRIQFSFCLANLKFQELSFPLRVSRLYWIRVLLKFMFKTYHCHFLSRQSSSIASFGASNW